MLGTGLSSAIGHSILIVGLAASVFGAFALATGTALRNERVQRAVHLYGFVSLGAAVGAVVLMERGLITRDWSLAYVQKVGSLHTPALFNFTALWSALEGSILLWLLLLAMYLVIVLRRYKERLTDPLISWTSVVMFAVTAFFFFLSLGPTDAFRQGVVPANFDKCCTGPNPM